VPAVLATAVFAFFVKDRTVASPRRLSVRQTFTALGRPYRRYLTATAVFSLGYFSFAFLVLKAGSVGFEAREQVLLYGLFNLVFTIVSVPVGRLGDRLGRRTIVVASYIVYGAMAAGFAWADSRAAIAVLFVVYGVFYAMDEGQSKAFLADLSADETRATAIGIYGFVTGLVYLPASLIAGVLWSYGPAWTFAFAAATSAIALTLFLCSAESRSVRGNLL
jgi:MFS family permease